MDGTEIAVSPRSLHSELMCPICLDMLKNTMTTKECLHRFCSDCIVTALRSGYRGPRAGAGRGGGRAGAGGASAGSRPAAQEGLAGCRARHPARWLMSTPRGALREGRGGAGQSMGGVGSAPGRGSRRAAW